MEDSGQLKISFIAGLDLSESFYREEIKPIIETEFSGVKYSAALIGGGSEVLGFDTEMSSDHCWGPRTLLFLEFDDYQQYAELLLGCLAERLPPTFRSYPTCFSGPAAPVGLTTASLNYSVVIHTQQSFFSEYLGFDLKQTIQAADWLTFPEQKLATITGGRIFHDQLGLAQTCQRFAYYPHDTWLYLLACGWNRIEQEEHLMGRAGYVGDELGSAIIGARLVRDLMRLCFLMEKVYAPYPKWFGSAFLKLKAADLLEPILRRALGSDAWQQRQDWLCQAYELLANLHNSLGITETMNARSCQFHERPFRVISMGAFSKAICEKIGDPAIRRLLSKPLIGSVDQFSDNTDILSNSLWRDCLAGFYGI